MKLGNPALFECKKSKDTLHTWQWFETDRLMCAHCKIYLTPEQSKEVATDHGS